MIGIGDGDGDLERTGEFRRMVRMVSKGGEIVLLHGDFHRAVFSSFVIKIMFAKERHRLAERSGEVKSCQLMRDFPFCWAFPCVQFVHFALLAQAPRKSRHRLALVQACGQFYQETPYGGIISECRSRESGTRG